MAISKVRLPDNTTQDIHDVRVVSEKIVYEGEELGETTYTADGQSVDISDYVKKDNLKTINNQSLVGTGNISISGGSGEDSTPELFEATYGVTTLAELQTALNNGLIPYCIYEGRFHWYSWGTSADAILFHCTDRGFNFMLSCHTGNTGTTWSSQVSEILTNSTRSQTLSLTDEWAQSSVPSVAAVNSGLSEKQDTISDLDTIRSGAVAGATALQSYTETDPTVPSHVKNITENDITNWNSKTSNTGTLIGVSFNGTNATVNNGVAAITASIPAETKALNDKGYISNGIAVESAINGVKLTTAGGGLDSNNAAISASSSNPYFGVKQGSNKWYAQAYNNYFYFGPTSAKALRLDQNGNGVFTGSVTAASIIKDGGTSSQFLKADGSVDTNSYATASSIPKKVSDLTNDSGFITDAGVTSFNGSTGDITYTAPVTSVNGSTGEVTISIPSKTSDLTNDSGFLTSESSLSKGTTTGSGNAVTDISVSGHQITLTKGTTFLTEHQSLKTINGQSITGSGNVTINAVPSYSSSNNGQILGVVNGALAWITPVNIYSGSNEPNSTTGNNGDLYLQS